ARSPANLVPGRAACGRAARTDYALAASQEGNSMEHGKAGSSDARPAAVRAGIRACVFDAYGTLFDYASAAAKCRDVLGDKFAALATLWRDKQLQYTWLRSLQGRHADFWQVTGDALDVALETFDIADPALRARLMNLYLTLDAFPDVSDALLRLKAAGLQTAILSNGTPDMLRAAVDGAGIAPLLDLVLSVE